MKLRSDLAAGLSICYGVEDVPWATIAAQIHVADCGRYSAEDVKAAAVRGLKKPTAK